MIALFLGLWIALAPALFAAPAAGLTLQMSTVHVGGSNDCDCCSDAKHNRDLCASMCANVLPFATLESDDLVSTVALALRHYLNSIGLGARELNHLGPLLRFLGDEIAEVRR
jgi:hypothetical protein